MADRYIISILFSYFLNQAHTWFLDIDLVREVCVCVCVCVSAPKASNNQRRDVAWYGPHMIA